MYYTDQIMEICWEKNVSSEHNAYICEGKSLFWKQNTYLTTVVDVKNNITTIIHSFLVTCVWHIIDTCYRYDILYIREAAK